MSGRSRRVTLLVGIVVGSGLAVATPVLLGQSLGNREEVVQSVIVIEGVPDPIGVPESAIPPDDTDLVDRAGSVGSMETFGSIDPLGMLSWAHQRMVDVGGAMVLGHVEGVKTSSNGVEGVVVSDRVLFRIDSEGLPALTSDLTNGRGVLPFQAGSLGKNETAAIGQMRPTLPVIALLADDGELLGIAPAEPEDYQSVATGMIDDEGPLFLVEALQSLALHGIPPLPGNGLCDPYLSGETKPIDDTPVSVLLQYFQLLGSRTRFELVEQLATADQIVEDLIEEAPPFTDPVLDVLVPLAVNDLTRQVEGGVATPSFNPTYPVGIVLAGDPNEAASLLVFVDDNDRVFAWLNLAPSYYTDAAGIDRLNSTLSAYIEGPTGGSQTRLYLRRAEDNIDCPPAADETPVMTIPNELLFGSSRALIHLDTLTVTDLTRDQFAS